MTIPTLHFSREERAYVSKIARAGAVPSLLVTTVVSVPPMMLAAYGYQQGDFGTTLVAVITLATTQLLLRVYLKPKRFVLGRMLARLGIGAHGCDDPRSSSGAR
jgi:hypothetical protein